MKSDINLKVTTKPIERNLRRLIKFLKKIRLWYQVKRARTGSFYVRVKCPKRSVVVRVSDHPPVQKQNRILPDYSVHPGGLSLADLKQRIRTQDL